MEYTRGQKDYTLPRKFSGFLVHIPKTGGSTLRKAFATYEVDGHCTGHNPAYKLRTMHPEEFPKTPVFSIVRNPWDRAVSWFYSHGQIRDRKEPHDLGEVIGWFRDWLFEHGRHFLGGNFHPSVQELLSEPYRREPQIIVDFVGKFEDYDRCYDEMFRIMGVSKPPKQVENISRKRNEDGRPPYQDYYDTRCRYYLEGLCWWEIEHFGYRFDDGPRAFQ